MGALSNVDPLFAAILRTHGVAPKNEATAKIRCPRCGGLTRFTDAPCEGCSETGHVLACVQCRQEPIDPMFAPACSAACRGLWERSQPAPIVKKAP